MSYLHHGSTYISGPPLDSTMEMFKTIIIRLLLFDDLKSDGGKLWSILYAIHFVRECCWLVANCQSV